MIYTRIYGRLIAQSLATDFTWSAVVPAHQTRLASPHRRALRQGPDKVVDLMEQLQRALRRAFRPTSGVVMIHESGIRSS
jgi:hypothetical protein